MIRNLKTLGLTLFASLALGVVAASAASAQEQGVLTSDGPVTLTGKTTPETVNITLAAFGSQLACPNKLYTGHKYNVTPHEGIPNGATTTTITLHYGACTWSIFNFPTTVDMNGCDYVFDLGKTTPAGNKEKTYGITTTVVCPPEKHIQVTTFTSGSAHGVGTTSFCTITITENAAGYQGLHATDLGTGKIRIHGTIQSITADMDRGPHPLPFGVACNEAETEAAEVAFDMTVSGHNPAKPKTETPISISEIP
jgi:hypothetical protein